MQTEGGTGVDKEGVGSVLTQEIDYQRRSSYVSEYRWPISIFDCHHCHITIAQIKCNSREQRNKK